MKMSEKKDIWQRIEQMDRRIVYAFVIISIAIPIAKPMGLPITIGEATKAAYDYIDAQPSGIVVLCGLETSAAGYPSQGWQMHAYAQDMLDRGMKLVFVSGFVDGSIQVDIKLFPSLDLRGKTYGVDYVNLGYLAGGPTGMAAFASDITQIFKTDYYGTPISEIPLMKNIKSINDFQLAVVCTSGVPSTLDYLEQYSLKYGTPVVSGTLGSAPELIPYFKSGQLKGYMPDIRGAAEYEILSGHPGYAVSSLDASSSYAIVILSLVIFGNIAMLVERSKKSKEVAA
jgi:hypothetical protein